MPARPRFPDPQPETETPSPEMLAGHLVPDCGQRYQSPDGTFHRPKMLLGSPYKTRRETTFIVKHQEVITDGKSSAFCGQALGPSTC